MEDQPRTRRPHSWAAAGARVEPAAWGWRLCQGSMSSRVPSAFRSLAEQLAVVEIDLLVAEYEGITTADECFFRHPSSEAIEAFLTECIHPRQAVRIDGGGIEVQARVPNVTAAAWLRSGAAAGLRRLWEASKSVSKRDLDRLTEDRLEGEAPRKVNAVVCADLAAKAEARGLAPQLDTERPGPATIVRVLENFKLGGAFQYIPWEEYVSEEEELRARRLGLTKKEVGFRIVPAGDNFKGVRTEEDLRRQRIGDQVALEETLHVRAVAHEYLELCDFTTYSRLTIEFVRFFRRRPPECMRGPTLNELRLVDRLIHTDILSFVARGEGNLAEGLRWYLGDGRSHRVWDVLEPVLESTPDRGRERPREPPAASGAKDHTALERDHSRPPAKCRVCGKPRSEHKGRAFCKPIPKDVGTKDTGRAPLKKDGGPPRTLPAHMQGMAATVPGQKTQFCWNFHNPDKGCTVAKCKRSHKRPTYVNGKVCMKAHTAFDCAE